MNLACARWEDSWFSWSCFWDDQDVDARPNDKSLTLILMRKEKNKGQRASCCAHLLKTSFWSLDEL
jgi:hypothetical protein